MTRARERRPGNRTAFQDQPARAITDSIALGITHHCCHRRGLLDDALGAGLLHWRRVRRSAGVAVDYPATYEQMLALGRDPLTGRPLDQEEL